jgi:hypothetical protein
MKSYTVIYSENSIEACKKLLNEFFVTFNITGVYADDIFYYGVFCKDITYANFSDWGDAPSDLNIPSTLTNPCNGLETRLEYVNDIMLKILMGEIEKPEWMTYIEMNTSADEYDQAPSTFLYVIPKNTKYTNLAAKLIEFLYSPNMIIRVVEC